MAYIVENEVKANTPVLMCSVPGYDASGRVMDLAAQLGKQLTDIAIGMCRQIYVQTNICADKYMCRYTCADGVQMMCRLSVEKSHL